MVNAAQVRMAMAALQWNDQDLADRSGLHRNTVLRARNGKTTDPRTMALIEQTLAVDGVDFVAPEKGGPGVRYRPLS